VIGTLFSARDEGGTPYTLDDQGFLQDLADRAALAIDNTGLYQQLIDRERRLQDLVGRLLAAQEEERRRVAYEVHDELAQVAASTHQHLQAFARYHRPRSPEARDQLDRAVDLAQRTVRETRRVVANLRPTTLDDFGLAAAIRLQIEELQAQGWRISYRAAIGDDRLPPAVETALFRVAQEALTNVRKHAQTTEVRVVLERMGRMIRLEVRDAGRGFDRSIVQAGGGVGERVGLPGMQERIALLGGRCTIESRIGHGTTVTALVPVAVGGDREPVPSGVSPA
jgi:signal transduction histidine kinase